MGYIRKKLSSNSLRERIVWTAVLFFVLFFGIMLLSYFFLPEGLLKNKNPMQNWDNSDNTLVLALQIFLYNLLSVIIIFLASLFGQKKQVTKTSFPWDIWFFSHLFPSTASCSAHGRFLWTRRPFLYWAESSECSTLRTGRAFGKWRGNFLYAAPSLTSQLYKAKELKL